MMDDILDFLGLGAVLAYLAGIPITFGYLFTVVDGDGRYGVAVLGGAIGWPLYLLGKIGAWLAS